MTQPQKEPLRAMSEQGEQELQGLVKATSERLDVVRRAGLARRHSRKGLDGGGA
jgi:hypothetical protein